MHPSPARSTWQAIYNAQAHKGLAGRDRRLFRRPALGALAAHRSLAKWRRGHRIPTEGIDVTVEGDLDLRHSGPIEGSAGRIQVFVSSSISALAGNEDQLNALRAETGSIAWSYKPRCIREDTLRGPRSEAGSLYPVKFTVLSLAFFALGP
jgi:hypothetical protein